MKLVGASQTVLMEDVQGHQACDEENTNFMWPMAKERLIGRDKHPFVLFSSVGADPRRRIHPSCKYTVIANLKIFNEEVYILFFFTILCAWSPIWL